MGDYDSHRWDQSSIIQLAHRALKALGTSKLYCVQSWQAWQGKYDSLLR